MPDGFSTEGGFNRLHARVPQRPGSGWAGLFMALAGSLGLIIAPLAEASGLISGNWAGALAAGLILGSFALVLGLAPRWSRPAELELTGAELKVTALFAEGLPLRRARRVLPLENLEWRWVDVGARAPHIDVHLTLQSGDAPPLTLLHLECGPDQQAALNAAWTAARDRARQLEGDGTAEVPAALANLRAQAVEPPKG